MPTDHSSPSMTKSNGVAWQRKIFPRPSSSGNEGSVTSVDTEPPRHRHMVALELNPVLSSPSAERSVYKFTHQRSPTRNSSEGSDKFEWTNSSNHGVVKKKRLNVSSISKSSHGRKTEEWDPAHEIQEDVLQAAAALVKLWSDETPGQTESSSSSSAGDVFRRSWSSPKTADRLDYCGEILLQSGETRPEDATLASVLSRPCNKRRYRMMVDLLAETTPTV